MNLWKFNFVISIGSEMARLHQSGGIFVTAQLSDCQSPNTRQLDLGRILDESATPERHFMLVILYDGCNDGRSWGVMPRVRRTVSRCSGWHAVACQGSPTGTVARSVMRVYHVWLSQLRQYQAQGFYYSLGRCPFGGLTSGCQ